MSTSKTTPIRVGIVGASAGSSWSAFAHMPAIANLPEFEAVAVATTRQASADAAAEAWGVSLAFEGAQQLVEHPDVDLVAVVVRVPYHAEVIRAALAAGKHVYSEWPLAVDLEEAVQLRDLAAEAGVVHAVGLQGIYAPGARYVRDLIAEGRIGRVDSVNLDISSSYFGGSTSPAARAWCADNDNGAHLLSIEGGAVFSTLATMVGPLRDVTATVANRNEQVALTDTGETAPGTVLTHIAVTGALADGAVASVAMHGGIPAEANSTTVQITGNEGVLRITAKSPGGGISIDELAITLIPGDGETQQLEVPDSYNTVPDAVPAGYPRNVAAVYQEIAKAIDEGREPYPSFETGVQYHRLFDAIELAASSGQRQAVEIATS